MKLLFFVAAMLWMPGITWATPTDTAWQGDPAAQGSWHEGTNWTVGVPGNSNSAKIDNGGTAVISADADVRYLYVGDDNSGTILQATGWLHPVWEVHLGYGANSLGRYELSGTGVVAKYYQDLYVGGYGSGQFVQTGQSICSMGDITLGQQEGSHGTYELTDATVNAQQMFIGRDGTGVFTQNSGTVSVTRGSPAYLRVGYGYWGGTGQGTYELKSGDLDTNTVLVGNGSVGLIDNTGGRHFMHSYDMLLGNSGYPHGEGTYHLGGNAELDHCDQLRLGLGAEGLGKFKQSGGTSLFNFVELGTRVGAGEFEVAGGGSSTIRTGQFTQGNNGTLVSTVMQDGLSTIEVARVENFYGDGSALLQGTWRVEDGGAPAGMWNVLTAAGGISISGDFDVSLPDDTHWAWGNDGNTLWVEHVPEPSTLTLLAIAVACLAFRTRRLRKSQTKNE